MGTQRSLKQSSSALLVPAQPPPLRLLLLLSYTCFLTLTAASWLHGLPWQLCHDLGTLHSQVQSVISKRLAACAGA
jgi:hypothetical protein